MTQKWKLSLRIPSTEPEDAGINEEQRAVRHAG
jgi:hypothetical protein